MATHVDNENHIIISSDDVRSGVTGHNVVYVLEYSMAGVIAAFTAIALYASYDTILEKLAAAFSQGLSGIVSEFAPYLAIVAVSALGAWLLLKLWTRLGGPSDDDSQSFMRARVVTQFAVICALVAVSFYSTT